MNVVELIVPDVHEQVGKLKRILKKYKDVPAVSFCGDFMDSYNGFTEETHLTVRWLKENVRNPKYKFLFGNHDIHYAYPLNELLCSGFDRHKLHLVQKTLNAGDWGKFGLMHWVGVPPTNDDRGNLPYGPTEWLVSHAGIHPSLLHPFHGFEKSALAGMEQNALWKLRYCQEVSPLLLIGRGRGGSARVGGIDWLDWTTEFVPIPGLNQIVGHTNAPTIRTNHTATSHNYCIDTHLRHVMLVGDDGSVKIEEADL